MNRDIIHTLFLSAAFLSVFGIAELLHHRSGVKAESTRKFVHIFSGLLTLLFPVLLSDWPFVLLLCGSFALLLVTSMRFSFLKSINGVQRKTWGSIAFPVAIFTCFLFYQHTADLVTFYLPVLILALSDPLAAFTGRRWPRGAYKSWGGTKTLSGSFAFFASACTVALTLLVFRHEATPHTLWAGLAIGLTATVAEGISGKGLDNLTIPLATVIVMLLVF